jgi:hypothetical protein
MLEIINLLFKLTCATEIKIGLGLPPAIVAQALLENFCRIYFELSSNLCLLLYGCTDGVHRHFIYRLR